MKLKNIIRMKLKSKNILDPIIRKLSYNFNSAPFFYENSVLSKYWTKIWISIFSALNYHNFDDDLMSDLPSCVYGGQHLTPIESIGNIAGAVGIGVNSNSGVSVTLLPRNSTTICGLPTNNLRHQHSHQYTHIPQHHHHHHHHHPGKIILFFVWSDIFKRKISFEDYDSPSTSTSSPVNLSAGASHTSQSVTNTNGNNTGGGSGQSSLSTFGGCNSPYKIQRQQQTPQQTSTGRERKRIIRSAPNGYEFN